MAEREYTVGERNWRLFWIDDPDGSTVITAITERSDAEDWAVELNRAYQLGRDEGRREERERCARKADEDADLHTGGGLGKAARDTANRIAAEIRNA